MKVEKLASLLMDISVDIISIFILSSFIFSVITLMDANYTNDEELGDREFSINTLCNDEPIDEVFEFPGGSKIYTTLTLTRK